MTPGFLSSKSELATLIREKDWSSTSLGSFDQWPQSLKTTVGVMLANRFPCYIIWGPEFLQLYNDAYVSILGLERHPKALGEKSEITWPDIWDTIGPMYKNVYQTGEPIGFDNYFLPRLRNGVLQDAYYSFSYNPLWDETGKVGGIVVLCEETTEKILSLQRLEASLLAKEAMNSQIFEILEGMSDAFFTLDKNWKILRVNKQFEKILNLKRDDVLGKSLLELFFSTPEQKESMYVKCYAKAMTDKVTETFIDYYEPFNIWTSVTAYPTSSGGLAVFFREISEERRASQKLQNAITSRDTFMSIASHELRTPLTSLKLQNQMMERRLLGKSSGAPLDSEAINKFVIKNGLGLERMNRLVEDMLDISRIQSGKLHMEFINSDINIVIKEIIERYSSQLEQAGNQVTLNSPKKNCLISMDVFRIEQVFINLLTNAIRYAPHSPVVITLQDQDPNQIQIIFQDSGKGIAEADHERVFNRFERVISANEVSGLGLGLFIVKEIISGHGGTIHLENGKEPGARFVIRLPRTQHI